MTRRYSFFRNWTFFIHSNTSIRLAGSIDNLELAHKDLFFGMEWAHYAQGGFSPLSIKAASAEDPYTYKVKKNDLHTLAASSETEFGQYFAWGETTGHAASSNAFVFGIDNACFAWINCPYAVGGASKFGKYVPSSQATFLAEGFSCDAKTVLDLEDDAAFWNWGGSWRMPTQEEFAGLAALDPEYTGWDGDNKGYRLEDTNGNSIFLPAAGYLKFNSSNGGYVGTGSYERYGGHLVRPLSE